MQQILEIIPDLAIFIEPRDILARHKAGLLLILNELRLDSILDRFKCLKVALECFVDLTVSLPQQRAHVFVLLRR